MFVRGSFSVLFLLSICPSPLRRTKEKDNKWENTIKLFKTEETFMVWEQRGSRKRSWARCWVSVSMLAYVLPAGFFLVWSTWWPCALIGSVLVAMETQPWVNDTPSEHVLGKRQETRTAHTHIQMYTDTHILSNTFWPVLEDSCCALVCHCAHGRITVGELEVKGKDNNIIIIITPWRTMGSSLITHCPTPLKLH